MMDGENSQEELLKEAIAQLQTQIDALENAISELELKLSESDEQLKNLKSGM